MSLRKSNSDPSMVSYRKPRADLYTVMLAVALVALIVATVFAYVASLRYGSPPYQAPSAMRSHGEANAPAICCVVPHDATTSPA